MAKEPLLSARDIEIEFSLRGKILKAIRKCSLDLYEGDTQVSAVARALEGKPEGRDFLSPLPEGFQVRSVWLEENICYLNFSSALLEGLEEDAVRIAFQALEDSLRSLEAVEEVRFLVDGEFRRNPLPADGKE